MALWLRILFFATACSEFENGERSLSTTEESKEITPKLGVPFIIETDASGKGVGAILMQAQSDNEKDLRVIAYASRVYNKHERNYPAIELEALGVVFALQKFKPYIDGSKTIVITDHSPLRTLLYRKDLQGRMAKYQLAIQAYDIEIRYRPGKASVIADALSRNHPAESALFFNLPVTYFLYCAQ